MRLITWILKALVFFTLFAFALNNQHMGSVRWFFGVEWQAPMVFVVLAAFAAGCALGVVAMVPGRWKARQLQVKRQPAAADPARSSSSGGGPAASDEPVHPPRDGL